MAVNIYHVAQCFRLRIKWIQHIMPSKYSFHLLCKFTKWGEKKNCLIHWHIMWNWDSKSYHKNSIVRIFSMPIHTGMPCHAMPPNNNGIYTQQTGRARNKEYTLKAGKWCKNALIILYRYYHVTSMPMWTWERDYKLDNFCFLRFSI